MRLHEQGIDRAKTNIDYVRQDAAERAKAGGAVHERSRRGGAVHIVRGTGGARVEKLGESDRISGEPETEAGVQYKRAEPSEAWFAGGVLRERVCFGVCGDECEGVGGERGGVRVGFGEAGEGEGGEGAREGGDGVGVGEERVPRPGWGVDSVAVVEARVG